MTGVFAVVLAAGCSAHLHSSDGTALWQTLLAPGVERADVRGRQLAWLLVVGPPAVAADRARRDLPTVTIEHGALGGGAAAGRRSARGAGLMLFVSVYVPIRMTDPHRRGSNPGQDGGSLAGLVWLVLPVVAVASAPVITLLAIGQAENDPLLQWAGTPAGIAIGALLAWVLGRMAYRRLAARGPELLAKVGTV